MAAATPDNRPPPPQHTNTISGSATSSNISNPKLERKIGKQIRFWNSKVRNTFISYYINKYRLQWSIMVLLYRSKSYTKLHFALDFIPCRDQLLSYLGIILLALNSVKFKRVVELYLF